MALNITNVVGGVRSPVLQQYKSSDLNQYVLYSYSQGYNTNAFNGQNTDMIQLKIEPSSLPGPISQMMLRFKLTSTSTAVQLMPSPYWVNRIELWQDSDNEFQRFYNDELFINHFIFQRPNKMRSVKAILNMNQEDRNYFYSEWMAPSTTQYYYLPIPSTFIEAFNLNLSYMKGEPWVRIYPASTPINIDGSTSYTPTVGEIALVYQSTLLSSKGKATQIELYRNPKSQMILHPILVPTQSVSYASSTSYTQTLESVTGKCPLIVFCLRTSSSNTSQAVLKNVDLGDNCTVSVATPSGQDILYNGNPSRVSAVKFFAVDEIENADFMNDRNYYVIPFCENVGKSLLGQMNGFVQFDGSKYQLTLNTGASGTACTQTVTLSAAATAGNYYLSFRGAISAELAYNASTSAMATAFNNMLSAQLHPKGPLTATFSATAAAGTSVVITITGPNGNIVQVDDLVTFVFDTNTSASQVTASTAISQYAVSGFPTATSYFLVVYAYVFATIQFVNGKLRRVIE